MVESFELYFFSKYVMLYSARKGIVFALALLFGSVITHHIFIFFCCILMKKSKNIMVR
ncbi:hypothetical protein ERO13_A03G172250v2 [Gossypium hirsutum]|nr:hypothetical protein ERO13_A03G172250v2 [Gossypium hirsutum]